jgi:glucose-6-phosphate-specific signal transduction histidine kinase
MPADLLDDVGQARVTAIESRAQRMRRLRTGALCRECARILEELAMELDPDYPVASVAPDDWRGAGRLGKL